MHAPAPTLRFLLPLPPVAPQRVLIFSGHMIDSPDRAVPRFPPTKEAAVRERIAAQLNAWNAGSGDLAISGAARGGDILFAEECLAREVEVWLFLPRTEGEFLEESVRLATGDWENRFHALRKNPHVRTLLQPDFLAPADDGLSVHARNNLWMLQVAEALVPASAILGLLVWDEQDTGDGPGGTADFAARARASSDRSVPIINPTKLPTKE